MTDFRARPALIVREKESWATFRLTSEMSAPGEEHLLAERDFLERIRASLPEGVIAQPAGPAYEDLIDRPGPEPFAEEAPKALKNLVSPDIHWARLTAARDRLDRAGATGTSELMGVPSGWVRLMEGLAEGLAPLLEAEPGARLHFRQIKEKFGTLRVYTTIDGSEEFTSRAREVVGWATAASERRCALTGRPGFPDPAGWYLILCPEAIGWRRTQRDAFNAAIYPDPPKAEPDTPKLEPETPKLEPETPAP
jgi:hypothetical protein